jgi:hypothetical protein
MSEAAHQPDVQPSMLPSPPPQPVYVLRLRMRITALTNENRELKRTLAQVRRELQGLHHWMRKKGRLRCITSPTKFLARGRARRRKLVPSVPVPGHGS